MAGEPPATPASDGISNCPGSRLPAGRQRQCPARSRRPRPSRTRKRSLPSRTSFPSFSGRVPATEPSLIQPGAAPVNSIRRPHEARKLPAAAAFICYQSLKRALDVRRPGSRVKAANDVVDRRAAVCAAGTPRRARRMSPGSHLAGARPAGCVDLAISAHPVEAGRVNMLDPSHSRPSTARQAPAPDPTPVVSVLRGEDQAQHGGRDGMDIGMRHNGTPLDYLGQVPGALGALTWLTRPARTRGGQIAVFTR
jgi:hypothetical protein